MKQFILGLFKKKPQSTLFKIIKPCGAKTNDVKPCDARTRDKQVLNCGWCNFSI